MNAWSRVRGRVPPGRGGSPAAPPYPPNPARRPPPGAFFSGDRHDDENAAPDPTGFLREFDEKQRACKTLSDAIHGANKEVLFPLLAAAGITSILVRFDGSGDSGQIEDVDIVSGDKPTSLPAANVSIQRAYWGATEPETIECNVKDAVETPGLRLA